LPNARSAIHRATPTTSSTDLAGWGASVWIEPVHPLNNWAQFAPPLAGLPVLSAEQAEQVLEMGQGANGHEIQPPMHIYRLSRADAQAVIAYLRSLPTPH